MESKIYKNNISKQFNYLLPAIFTLLFIAALCLFVSKKFDISATFFVISILLLIDTIPTIIIHFNYLYRTRGHIIQINEGVIKQIKENAILEIPTTDVVSISKIKSDRYTLGGRFSFANYFYYVFEFSNNKKMYITCLMTQSESEIFSYELNRLCIEKFELYPFIR